MKKQQKIRQSRLFRVGPSGWIEESEALTPIMADIQRHFPVVKRLIWSSYRADNDIHELLIDHDERRFVLTIQSGFGPTVFTPISEEDWAIHHKQVELVDSVDIFHFIRSLIERFHLHTVRANESDLIYTPLKEDKPHGKNIQRAAD
ncbi:MULTISPECIES: hypothetical protein [Providencia]|uniref:hypothetical protein n=1 Tax=Providencia TaxID=586 RepID=UPI001124B0C0|nr:MULTISPECIES: hypothetical protein [Providencia]